MFRTSHLRHSMTMLAAAALAAARTPQTGTTIVSQRSGNDEKEGLKAMVIDPIVTREMLAGTQPRLKPGALRQPKGTPHEPATDLGVHLGKKKPFDAGRDLPTAMMAHVPHVTNSRTMAAAHA